MNSSSRKQAPPPPLWLKIISDPATLASTRRAVEMFAAQCGFDETSRGEIGLVVNEAIANVIRHAYQGATDQPIELTAQRTDEGMSISLRDWGLGVNPLDLPPRKHDPMKPGGVGLICMRQMMDEMQFHKQPDGMLLTMSRSRIRRKPQGAKEAC
jgi:serine/threonine-protein kinase RsbW